MCIVHANCLWCEYIPVQWQGKCLEPDSGSKVYMVPVLIAVVNSIIKFNVLCSDTISMKT